MAEFEPDQTYGPSDPSTRSNAYYEISGFRSLHDFKICLKSGLNVLLGTNGSGKTNFIDFLDFVTTLVTRDCSSAISASGGVARVFSQEALKRKLPRVQAKISGLADIQPQMIGTKTKRRFFRFEYEVDVRYSKFHTAVYIAHEKIKFKNLHAEDAAFDCENTVGSIEIHRRSPLAEDEARWVVGNYLVSNAPRNPLRHLHTHRISLRSMRHQPPIDTRAQFLAEPPSAAPGESVLSSRMAFPALDAVREALSRGRSFNLNPQRARTPDDISRPPVIEADGSGLSSTIYQMQQTKKAENRPSLARRRFPKDALETIVSWTQLVIPDLLDITATADPHTGKYLVYLIIGDEDNPLKIPLQSTSDGTLKWLAFVCLAVSQGNEYTFEEPENYLHPRVSIPLAYVERMRYIMGYGTETPHHDAVLSPVS